MLEEIIKDAFAQRYKGAVQINCDTSCHKYMETERGIKREVGIKRETERETTATTETEINCKRERERENRHMNMLSAQFISQNESVISIIYNKEMN